MRTEKSTQKNPLKNMGDSIRESVGLDEWEGECSESGKEEKMGEDKRKLGNCQKPALITKIHGSGEWKRSVPMCLATVTRCHVALLKYEKKKFIAQGRRVTEGAGVVVTCQM